VKRSLPARRRFAPFALAAIGRSWIDRDAFYGSALARAAAFALPPLTFLAAVFAFA
jgi:hypothetical protein